MIRSIPSAAPSNSPLSARNERGGAGGGAPRGRSSMLVEMLSNSPLPHAVCGGEAGRGRRGAGAVRIGGQGSGSAASLSRANSRALQAPRQQSRRTKAQQHGERRCCTAGCGPWPTPSRRPPCSPRPRRAQDSAARRLAGRAQRGGGGVREGGLYYAVRRDGQNVLLPSRPGLRVPRRGLAARRACASPAAARDSVDETWTQPWGEVARVRDHHNELRVQVAEERAPNRRFDRRLSRLRRRRGVPLRAGRGLRRVRDGGGADGVRPGGQRAAPGGSPATSRSRTARRSSTPRPRQPRWTPSTRRSRCR